MEPTDSGEPQKRGRGRPKGSRNRATIEREAMDAEIAGMLEVPEEEVPEEEIPEVPEAPAPAPARPRHVLDVSFESDEILGVPETPRKPWKARTAPEVSAHKPRAPVRQKRARPPSPEPRDSPPRPGSVGANHPKKSQVGESQKQTATTEHSQGHAVNVVGNKDIVVDAFVS